MATLYEIDRNIEACIEALLASVDEETGEVVDEDAAKYLEQLQVDRKDKLDALGSYIKNLMADTEALKAESAALAKRAKTKENEIEHLKNYVSMSLLNNGEEKFESTRVRFSFRKSESVNVTGQLTKTYLVKKVSFEPDKRAIKEAIHSGKKVAGAELVIKQNLQIK